MEAVGRTHALRLHLRFCPKPHASRNKTKPKIKMLAKTISSPLTSSFPRGQFVPFPSSVAGGWWPSKNIAQNRFQPRFALRPRRRPASREIKFNARFSPGSISVVVVVVAERETPAYHPMPLASRAAFLRRSAVAAAAAGCRSAVGSLRSGRPGSSSQTTEGDQFHCCIVSSVVLGGGVVVSSISRLDLSPLPPSNDDR